MVGSYRTAETVRRRVLASGLAAAIAIFLLLQAGFGSWRLAALLTLTLPVSLSGGVLAAVITRADMSLGALAGFLAVLAIAARGGVTVITRAQEFERDGGAARAAAVVQAAGERLGATVTTALATAVALVPLIVTGTVPGQEIAQPIAVVVAGGLVTAALVTAFLVPAVYAPPVGARQPQPLHRPRHITEAAVSRRTPTILLLTAAALVLPACGYSAAADEEGDGPASVEQVDGSDQARVVVKPAAARRIGLETAPVALGQVDRNLVVRGTVVAGDGGTLSVRVALPSASAGSVDASRPARILALAAGQAWSPGDSAALGVPGGGGARYYRLAGAGAAGLHAGARLRVQLALHGSGQRKTVPYSAVISIDGGTWVYARTGPLTFMRRPIAVDEVDGDAAVLARAHPPGRGS